MKINKLDKDNIPEHLAIIMDGNGRWAKKRGLRREQGHIEGKKSVSYTHLTLPTICSV